MPMEIRVLPTYYKGRIFIDLSVGATYSEDARNWFNRAWDQPLYVKPQLGEKLEIFDRR